MRAAVGNRPCDAVRCEGNGARRAEGKSSGGKSGALADAQIVAAKRALILGIVDRTREQKPSRRRRCELAQAEAGKTRRRPLDAARTNATRAQAGTHRRRTVWSKPRRRCWRQTPRCQAGNGGRAGRGLKKKFFATMPVRASTSTLTTSRQRNR